MVSKAALTALALAMSVLGCAASSRTPSTAIEQLEQARYTAMVSQDVEALRRLLGEDLTYCHSNGECETREQFLATISGGRVRYRDMQAQEIRVRRYGDVALVNGRVVVHGEVGGQSRELKLVYTSVHARRDGRWQLVTWQSTRLP